MGYFWGWGRVQKLFLGFLLQTNNFYFQSIALILLYHVVLSLCGGGGCGGRGMWFPANSYSQPKYSYGCFLLGLWLLLGCDNS